MKKALYILGSLSDGDTAWLVRNGAARRVSRGETLIHEGRESSSVFVLLEGELIVETAARGKLATLGPGEIAGEISFVDARPPTATVTTSRDSFVLSIPREALALKLEKDNGFAAHFYRALAVFLASRLRSTLNRGSGREDEAEELGFGEMDTASVAAHRFQDMVRMARGARAGETA